MARVYITFSANLDTGEADILPSSRREISDITDCNSLLAADILSDICGLSGQLYDAVNLIRRNEWDEARAKRKKRGKR